MNVELWPMMAVAEALIAQESVRIELGGWAGRCLGVDRGSFRECRIRYIAGAGAGEMQRCLL